MMMNCERADYYERMIDIVNKSFTGFWNRLGDYYRGKLRVTLQNAQTGLINSINRLGDDWGRYEEIAAGLHVCLDSLQATLDSMKAPGVDRIRVKGLLDEVKQVYCELAQHSPDDFPRAVVDYDEQSGEVYNVEWTG